MINSSRVNTLPLHYPPAEDNQRSAVSLAENIVDIHNKASPSGAAGVKQIPATQVAKFLSALYNKCREDTLVPDGSGHLPAGSFFIIPIDQQPSTQKLSRTAYVTELMRGFSALADDIKNPSAAMRERMVTTKLELRGGEPVIFARAHLFYLGIFRPAALEDFMKTFFQAIVKTYNGSQGSEFDKAATAAALAGMLDNWHQAETVPEFASSMKLKAFLKLCGELLKGETCSALTAHMQAIRELRH